MTTPSTPRKAGPLLGTGAQTSWPFTFKVFAASDIAVTIADSLGVETALVLNADYSVTVNSNQDTSPGGTVTYPISGSALPTGSKLTIFGNLPYDQPLDLPSGGNFSPLALENQLDRLTMQIQQLREQVGRSLQVSVTSSANVALPPPAASNLIGWNESGDNFENYPLSELATSLAFATYRYDTFTGNGSTTQFTLSADPVTLGNLDVAISGVTQVPGTDYLLVGGVLQFTSAPANGTVILARYGEGIASGPSMDSYDVRFRQAGTGSVDRTAEGKLRETVSVKDFGAVGDGVADDTAAIQAAIDYAGNQRKALYFPSANVFASYIVTAPLNFTKPISLIGDFNFGANIYASGFSAGEYILNFDLPLGTNYYFNIENLLIAGDGVPNGMLMKNISYTTVKNVVFNNLNKGIVITGGNCFSNSFENVVFQSIASNSILFENFTGGGQYLFNACTFDGEDGVLFADTASSDSLTFLNCNWENCGNPSTNAGSDMAIRGTVAGLTISGCRSEALFGMVSFNIDPQGVNFVNGISINGCFWQSNYGNGHVASFKNDVRGFNVTGNFGGYIAFLGAIVVDAGCNAGVVSGNHFTNAPKVLDTPRPGVAVFNNSNASGMLPESIGEEATWTPADASGAGLVFTGVSANYTKIGRLVTMEMTLTFPTTANSNVVSITLPQQCTATTNATAIIATNKTGDLSMAVVKGSNAQFSYYIENQNGVRYVNSAFSGRTIALSLTYAV